MTHKETESTRGDNFLFKGSCVESQFVGGE